MEQQFYLCDGLRVDCPHDYCYIYGGQCYHTMHIEHSIKKRLGKEFPPTVFINNVEEVVVDGDKWVHDGNIGRMQY